ncbi:MAG: hypothetical protein GYB68_05170 [Chloroflexi bacterium]|nr:hypothetical protein [Chloroflexota bacterium]
MGKNRIGIRKEDESRRFERRAPLTPEVIRSLIAMYPDASFLIERSERKGYAYERAYKDQEYEDAGAALVEGLSDADVIMGIKEVGLEHLMPDKVYTFFSHTYKGQRENMPLLRKLMQLRCTLIDYEMIVQDVEDEDYEFNQLPRDVYFGDFAGYVGIVDTLHALGQRLDYEGIANPFSAVKAAIDYHGEQPGFGSFAVALAAMQDLGDQIRYKGLPDAIAPLIIGVTGGGHSASGVMHMLERLPMIVIKPEELLHFTPSAEEAGHHVYVVPFRRSHRPPQVSPDTFESYLTHLTVLMNCIKWSDHEPRLVTRSFLKRLFAGSNQPTLRVVGDISGDPNGSVEVTKATYADHPVFVYEPAQDDPSQDWSDDLAALTTRYGVDGHGLVVMAVYNLPTSFPREASAAFSDRLSRYVPSLLTTDFQKEFEDLSLSRPLKRATILHKGRLTPDYMYLKRKVPARILVLGAGRMSPAVIEYLAKQGYEITVADGDIELAQQRVAGYPASKVNSVKLTIDTDNPSALHPLLKNVDVAISLMPTFLHPVVAEACIATRTHLVTASYVSPKMAALHEQAEAAGVTLLNETGFDPGLDHMSAMRLLDSLREQGMTITAFRSYAGGIPADPDVNPLGFKMSWSPAQIVGAMNRPARYLKDGEWFDATPLTVYENAVRVKINGYATMDAYANGDAGPYIESYGLQTAHTLIRGTLRYAGWGKLLQTLHELGWFTDEAASAVVQATTQRANTDPDLNEPLRWLELLVPEHSDRSAQDVFQERIARNPELHYQDHESDMVVMEHLIEATDGDSNTKRFISEFSVKGTPGGPSAMALTVGLPAAMAAHVIAQGGYQRPGVRVPTTPDLYEPILDGMAERGFAFVETVQEANQISPE